jgi:hypothetical protein
MGHNRKIYNKNCGNAYEDLQLRWIKLEIYCIKLNQQQNLQNTNAEENQSFHVIQELPASTIYGTKHEQLNPNRKS